MQLLQSWKDSLTLLKPQNLKLFCLVTLKSVISTYKTLVVYCWWLILALIVSYYFNVAVLSSEPVPLLIWYCKRAFLFFIVLVCARPSTVIKNYEYFLLHVRHCAWAMFFYLVMVPTIMATFFCLLNLIFFGSLFGPQGEGLSIAVSIITLPILVPLFGFLMATSLFVILFLLDSDGTAKSFGRSLVRGAKMFWYNLPFCLLYMVVRYTFEIALLYVIARPFNTVVIDILLPLPVCFMTNFYVKKLHEQFTIYFKPVENKG